jgi:hypothetical protein
MGGNFLESATFTYCILQEGNIEQNLLVHADHRPHGHRARNGNGIVHQCYKVRTVWA